MQQNQWNSSGFLVFGNMNCDLIRSDYKFKCGYFSESPRKNSFTGAKEQSFDEKIKCEGGSENGVSSINLADYDVGLGSYDNNIFGCMIYNTTNAERNNIGNREGTFELEFRYDSEYITVDANKQITTLSPTVLKGRVTIFKFNSPPLNGLLIDTKNGTIYGTPTSTVQNHQLVILAEYNGKVSSTFTIYVTSVSEVVCQATIDYLETAEGDAAYSRRCPNGEIGMKSKICTKGGTFQVDESDTLCSKEEPEYKYIKYTYFYKDPSCSPKYFHYKTFLDALKIYLEEKKLVKPTFLEFDTSVESSRTIVILLLDITEIGSSLKADLIGNDEFTEILKNQGWLCEFKVQKPQVVFNFNGRPITTDSAGDRAAATLNTTTIVVISILVVVVIIFCVVMVLFWHMKKAYNYDRRRFREKCRAGRQESLRILGSHYNTGENE